MIGNGKKMKNGEYVGFQTTGYIDKKGTTGEGTELPPGYYLEDQKLADINDMPEKNVTAGSYPGDGF